MLTTLTTEKLNEFNTYCKSQNLPQFVLNELNRLVKTANSLVDSLNEVLPEYTSCYVNYKTTLQSMRDYIEYYHVEKPCTDKKLVFYSQAITMEALISSLIALSKTDAIMFASQSFKKL